MKSMRCVIPVILLSFIVHEGTAETDRSDSFYGIGCWAGCWNGGGRLEIPYHNKEGVERYIIVKNITYADIISSCNGRNSYLDEDKH